MKSSLKRFFVILFCACIFFLLSILPAMSATKPIAGLKDYDGTYSGSPNTGSIGYTTLYRDNEDQGATSGCNGEGCGRHPAVDIPVPSKTPVLAAFAGTVSSIKSCNTGWGNLITIKSTNPYDSTHSIYHSYAHLNKILVSSGSTVFEGQQIGLSGGGSSDPCPGRSNGAHLHFQIDNDDGHGVPWFPTLADLNKKDSTYQVRQYTYNPIPFLTGKYHWSFDQNNFAEYWFTRNVSASGVSSGYLWIDGNDDPSIVRYDNVACGLSKPCSGQLSAEASLYNFVAIQISSQCVSNPARVYFITSLDNVWSDAKSVTFNYSGPNLYKIYMGGNPSWTNTIVGIRVDPAVTCNPNASDPSSFNDIALMHDTPPTSNLPDLTVSALSGPSTGTAGGQISISATVVNQGSVNAGHFYLGFYFSNDSSITTSDTFSGYYCDYSSLAAGSSSTCSGPIGIPSSLPPGTYYLGAIADYQSMVQETDETNNTRAAGPISISGNTTIEIRLFNVDDNEYADVNGTQRLAAVYHQDADFVNVTSYFLNGNNTIRLRLYNSQGGWTYGFQVRKNGSIIFDHICGTVGVTGCNNNDQTIGWRFDNTINITYP